MGKEPTRTQLANKVVEIAGASDVVTRRRSIDDLPRALASTEGAKEAAILTLAARSHDFEFEPVMEALTKLSKVSDWSHSFLVADTKVGQRPYFEWREAPLRKYKSFADFYERELEATWGKWEDLQRTWTKIVKGEITEDEGRKQIIERGKLRVTKGRPVKGTNTENVGTLKVRGNTRPYTLARLDRDHPDLAAKVDAGLMTTNAAAIEAGFRKKSVRKKLSRVERTQKAIAKWTEVERHTLWQYLDEEFGSAKTAAHTT